MANIEKLRAALKVTEERSSVGLWDQSRWLSRAECGTAGCFAGNWALHRGCSPLLDDDGEGWRVTIGDGEFVPVEEWATKDLGLTRTQARRLFAWENEMEDLERIVDEIVEGL